MLALPTINYILKKQPEQLIIASHLGRPKGVDKKLSLALVAKRLAELLDRPIYFHEHPLLPIENSEPIVLLENLRFFEGEKGSDKKFAKALAAHADVFINDAFATAHRKDASVFQVPKFLPSGIGLLMQSELKNVHLNHKKPIVAIFGAAKMKTKIPILKELLKKVDKLLIGGGVVFTFLQAMGIETGKSLVEPELISQAKKLLKTYGSKFVFPVDFIVANKTALLKFPKMTAAQRKKAVTVVSVGSIPKSKAGFDIGSQSIKLFTAVIKRSKTVIWNGPPGVFEVPPFNKSSKMVAKALAENNVFSIICGGDTVSAVRKTPYFNKMSHISSGGGASLELLAGNKLPALQVLDK